MSRKKEEKNSDKTKNKNTSNNYGKIYTLDVFITGGLIDKKYEGKVISRAIQIKGNQTLEDLHHIIFKAFDRYEEHLYEFNFGKGPYDHSKIYSLPASIDKGHYDDIKGDVTKTSIGSLKLKVNRAFGYLFDFGDDWMHQINVVAIDDYAGKGKYPKIIKKEGKSPPQYPDVGDE